MSSPRPLRPGRAAPRRGAALLALALALALPARPSAARAPPLPPQDASERVAAILAGPPERSAEALSRELADLGPEAAPALLAALAQAQERRAELALLGAIEARPAQVLALLEPLAAPEASPGERAAVVMVLSRIGRGEDLPLVVRASTPAREEDAVTPESARAFEFAAKRILRRQPAGAPLLVTRFDGVHADLRAPLVRAVASAQTREALSLLAKLLARPLGCELLLLAEISRVAARLPGPFDPEVALWVRSYLGEGDPNLQREAALAAGRLEDPDAVGPLVRMMESESRGVRENAHWALQRISGLGFHADPRAWARWMESELWWWQSQAPRCFRALREGSRMEVPAALNEITGRRFRRHELSREVARLLARGDPDLVRLACSALSQLGSRTAVPALAETLNHPIEEVRNEAWRALKAITGRDLPPDPLVWTLAAG